MARQTVKTAFSPSAELTVTSSGRHGCLSICSSAAASALVITLVNFALELIGA
jgi:hypothetical protein